MFRTRDSLKIRSIFRFVILVCLLFCGSVSLAVEENRSPTVGAQGAIEQIILPGTELAAKPIDERAPIVLRIEQAFPHGDSFRYDIVFHGMEPGQFDLAEYLQRKDGTSTEDLPEIPVEIRSLLPPGQIEPNALETGWLPSLGGYRNVMIAGVVIWVLGLLGLIFLGKKKKPVLATEVKPETLADLLKARIESAIENKIDTSGYAELERMLTAFWSKRMGLESLPQHEALVKIKADDNAGPLMRQLEHWMHSPHTDSNADLAKLLAPYKNLPVDASGFEA